MVDRTINRRYGISAAEVRTAIVLFLRERDHPYPKDDEYTLSVLPSGGMKMEWTEEVTDD